MEMRRLGQTGIEVSLICLGTMTWSQQNTEAEAHQQMDYAVSRGINFLDTAEMYPVPPKPETQGRTEECVGSWLAARKGRDKIVLATKVVGATRDVQHFRGGNPHLDARNINQAVEDSLKRLRTDYIDLYQLHWPDRKTNTFGKLGYEHDPDQAFVPLEETLEALAGLVQAGKVRSIGMSNETPWGLARYLHLSESRGLPRMASIQNAYNLVNRTFEVGLAEMAIREQCGLLAYSPLGGGTLTGKYLDGAKPQGARMTLFDRFTRYSNPRGEEAIGRYVALARQHGLDPAQMALAYVNTRPFLTATIIGATSLEQLKTDIDSVGVVLSPEVLAGIEAIQQDLPNPCP
jgi:aryl-alcohol dehydrogenase-like predicted oxidoreductase